jgi:hypothetical protein
MERAFSAISALAGKNSLCGVALFMPCGYYASAGFLGRLDLAKKSHSRKIILSSLFKITRYL